MKEPYRIRVEEPANGLVATVTAGVRGWIAGEQEARSIELLAGNTAVPVKRVRRSDVERAFPDKVGHGFQASVDFRLEGPLAVGGSLVLRVDGQEVAVATIDIASVQQAHLAWQETKQAKLAWLAPRLQCPQCGVALPVPPTPGDFGCRSCGTAYARTGHSIELIPTELRACFRLDPTENVSAHPYPREAMALFDEVAATGGMVLDVGCGDQRHSHPSIICAEVVPYPAADVLAAGQRLPFAEATFDAIYSNAVLEHVTDPFDCAREMFRVLKPGGRIFCSVPFLQPEHGYPHHYYNMTRDGLARLFTSLGAKVDRQWVPDWGHPMYAGQWFMSSYLQALPQPERERLESMTIAGFLKLKRNRSEPIFARLDDEARRTLACSNAALFTKPVG